MFFFWEISSPACFITATNVAIFTAFMFKIARHGTLFTTPICLAQRHFTIRATKGCLHIICFNFLLHIFLQMKQWAVMLFPVALPYLICQIVGGRQISPNSLLMHSSLMSCPLSVFKSAASVGAFHGVRTKWCWFAWLKRYVRKPSQFGCCWPPS